MTTPTCTKNERGTVYIFPRNYVRSRLYHVTERINHRSDRFRHLIRQGQCACMVGDVELLNLAKLRHQLYQSNVASLEATLSQDWWTHMTTPLSNSPGFQNEMLGLANAFTSGNVAV